MNFLNFCEFRVQDVGFNMCSQRVFGEELLRILHATNLIGRIRTSKLMILMHDERKRRALCNSSPEDALIGLAEFEIELSKGEL